MAATSSSWELGAIEDAASRISDLARDRGLDNPVEHLTRWKVRDVVAHQGGVHEWAARIVAERSRSGPGFKKSKLDGTELCDWFDAQAEHVVDVLRTNDFADTCPNFNPGSDNTVGWWARRMAHETTVHRWDVEQAFTDTTAIDATIAVDGIDEFLDVFVRTRGKQTLASTLTLRTTRPRRTWTLTPAAKPGRIDVAQGQPDISDGAATEVSGKPDALLLALWGRQTVAQAKLKVDGDEGVAASLLNI